MTQKLGPSPKELLTTFPVLTPDECQDTHLTILRDGRAFSLPAVIYNHIATVGFSSGVAYARTHCDHPQ